MIGAVYDNPLLQDHLGLWGGDIRPAAASKKFGWIGGNLIDVSSWCRTGDRTRQGLRKAPIPMCTKRLRFISEAQAISTTRGEFFPCRPLAQIRFNNPRTCNLAAWGQVFRTLQIPRAQIAKDWDVRRR